MLNKISKVLNQEAYRDYRSLVKGSAVLAICLSSAAHNINAVSCLILCDLNKHDSPFNKAFDCYTNSSLNSIMIGLTAFSLLAGVSCVGLKAIRMCTENGENEHNPELDSKCD